MRASRRPAGAIGGRWPVHPAPASTLRLRARSAGRGVFRRVECLDNAGCGLTADSGDGADCRFEDCRFLGVGELVASGRPSRRATELRALPVRWADGEPLRRGRSGRRPRLHRLRAHPGRRAFARRCGLPARQRLHFRQGRALAGRPDRSGRDARLQLRRAARTGCAGRTRKHQRTGAGDLLCERRVRGRGGDRFSGRRLGPGRAGGDRGRRSRRVTSPARCFRGQVASGGDLRGRATR